MTAKPAWVTCAEVVLENHGARARSATTLAQLDLSPPGIISVSHADPNKYVFNSTLVYTLTSKVPFCPGAKGSSLWLSLIHI